MDANLQERSERTHVCAPETPQAPRGAAKPCHTLVPDLFQVRTLPNQTRCQPPAREMDASGYHNSEEEISDVS